MGISVRVYFFEEGGRTIRIPRARFERLFDEEAGESLPEYAGKNMRCAMMFVDLEQRQPVRIRHIDYLIIPFDARGRLDFQEYHRAGSLAIQKVDVLLGIDRQDNVIDINPHLAYRKYREEFTWEPTEQELKLLIKEVFFEG